MYLNHFGLNDFPFRLSPDPDYLFISQGHAQAKSYVDYSLLTRDGFVIITGDVGSGKTTLMRSLLADWQDVAIILHVEQTQLTPLEFLQLIFYRLTGAAGSDNKVKLLQTLTEALERTEAQGMRVVLCVDEAQALTFEVLEELRFLTALESGKDKLLSVILMGQPELRQVLDSPGMEQMRQRVRLRFHLSGLTVDEVSAYVVHRLRIAGASRPDRIVAKDAWPVIHRYTGGIPRLVNALCDMMFLRALVADRRFIKPDLVLEAAQELGWPQYSERQASTVSALPRGAVRASQRGKASEDGAEELLPALEQLDQRLANLDVSLRRIADALEHANESSPARKRGAS